MEALEHVLSIAPREVATEGIDGAQKCGLEIEVPGPRGGGRTKDGHLLQDLILERMISDARRQRPEQVAAVCTRVKRDLHTW